MDCAAAVVRSGLREWLLDADPCVADLVRLRQCSHRSSGRPTFGCATGQMWIVLIHLADSGALLRETVRKPNAHVRWIDREQNMADVLTEANRDKTGLKTLLREGHLCLVQTEANKQSEELKRTQRCRADSSKEALRGQRRAARREQLTQEVAAEGSDISQVHDDKEK